MVGGFFALYGVQEEKPTEVSAALVDFLVSIRSALPR